MFLLKCFQNLFNYTFFSAIIIIILLNILLLILLHFHRLILLGLFYTCKILSTLFWHLLNLNSLAYFTFVVIVNYLASIFGMFLYISFSLFCFAVIRSLKVVWGWSGLLAEWLACDWKFDFIFKKWQRKTIENLQIFKSKSPL